MRNRQPLRATVRCLLLLLAMGWLPATLLAHDTWLVPHTFRPQAGQQVRVRLVTSEAFPAGESPVAPERVARFTLRTAEGTRPVSGYRVEGVDLVASLAAPAGPAQIVAETMPRDFVLEPAVFNQYLREEELTAILAARARRGQTDAPGRERYRKIAKAVLCSGEGSGNFFAQPEGLWLEIIPLVDPCALRVGDAFPVQVLFKGQPLAGVKLAAGYEGVTGHGYPVWLVTDAHGAATVRLDRPGAWFVRTLHMIPVAQASGSARQAGSEWESAFSTLTFEVRPARNAAGSAAAHPIRDVLDAQAAAWNRGDVESFMEGYWRSETLTFAGANGVTRGWQAVLERYQRNYAAPAAMGRLAFSDLEITPLGEDAVLVLGRWQLERAADRPGGIFTLVARRFPEGWRIIHDHTSSDAPR